MKNTRHHWLLAGTRGTPTCALLLTSVAAIGTQSDLSLLALEQRNPGCTFEPPPECVEEFVYRGAKHVGCTTHGFHRPWCSHQEKYKSRKYSYCKEICPEDAEPTLLPNTRIDVRNGVVDGDDANVPLPPSSLSEYCTPLEHQHREGYFKVGEEVKADWKGYGRYYSAKVTSRNHDGMYSLKYHDGVKEHGVQPDRIKRDVEKKGNVDPSQTDPLCKIAGSVHDLQREIDSAHRQVGRYFRSQSGDHDVSLEADGEVIDESEHDWREAVQQLQHDERAEVVLKTVDVNSDDVVTEAELMAALQAHGVSAQNSEHMVQRFFEHVFEGTYSGAMTGSQFTEALESLRHSDGPAPAPGPLALMPQSPAASTEERLEKAEDSLEDQESKIKELKGTLTSWEKRLDAMDDDTAELRELLQRLASQWQAEDIAVWQRPMPRTPDGRDFEIKHLNDLLVKRLKQLNNILRGLGLRVNTPPESPEDVITHMKEAVARIGYHLDHLRAKCSALEEAGDMDVELQHVVNEVLRAAGTMKVKLHEIIAMHNGESFSEESHMDIHNENHTKLASRTANINKDDFEKKLLELDNIMVSLRTDASDIDTKVVPNKEKWWRFRWEYSFVESVMLVFFLLIACFWECIHWWLRDKIFVEASTTPTFIPQYFDNVLVVSWARFWFAEMWVLMMVILTVWMLNATGVWRLWVSVSWSLFPGVNLPTEAHTYVSFATDIGVQLAISMSLFFVLMLSVVVVAGYTEKHLKKLEEGELDDHDGSARAHAVNMAFSDFAKNPSEYRTMKRFFEKGAKNDPDVQPALQAIRHDGKQFLLWYFITAKIQRGVEDGFMIRPLTWVWFIMTCIIIASLNWTLQVAWINITVCLLLLVLVPIFFWVRMAQELCAEIHREFEEFQNESMTTPRLTGLLTERQDRGHQLLTVVHFIFQVCLFFLCYAFARTIFSPWIHLYYAWQSLLIISVIVLFSIIFRMYLATLIVKFLVASSMPPHVSAEDVPLIEATANEHDRIRKAEMSRTDEYS